MPQHHYPPPNTDNTTSPSRVPRPLKLWRWIAVIGCLAVVSLWFGKLAIESTIIQIPSRFANAPTRAPVSSLQSGPVHWDVRKDQVRKAFLHAWTGYKTHAFPGDELRAVSGGSTNQYNGWSATLFDSLDTMWIMGLKDEFKDALESIKDRRFNVTRTSQFVPFFETTVRYLGGLLSAYALSEEPLLLKLAEELGHSLLPAFEGSSVGFPAFAVNVHTGKVRSDSGRDTIGFAEAASCQLEFKYLAKLTGRKEFYQRVQTAMDVLYKANTTLFRDSWSLQDGTPRGDHFTAVGSGYEYLLKQWLQTRDTQARDQYIRSSRGIIDNLLYITPIRGLLYVGDIRKNKFVHRLEHPSCHLGGLFALGGGGSGTAPPLLLLPLEDKELHEWAAHGLTHTCVLTYADQRSGLGAEEISMSSPRDGGRKWVREIGKWRVREKQKKKKKKKKKGTAPSPKPPGTAEPLAEIQVTRRDYWNTWGDTYLLRPETVESIFYMWRTTGDAKWRERGYRIFQAIEKHTRTKYGYSTVSGVDASHVLQKDHMPSWFLAETLKYLYLLFDDNSTITFDKWVFNTKGHPLPVFDWTEEERAKFEIRRLI